EGAVPSPSYYDLWQVREMLGASFQPQRGHAIRRQVRINEQVIITERAHGALFALPDHCRHVRRFLVFDPPIQTAPCDVETAIHAPARPLDATRQVNDPAVRLVESDVEKAQQLLVEPLDVFNRAPVKRLPRIQPA